MDVIRRAGAFTERLDRARAGGAVVGLVPTMGALHEGHASLIRRARSECDLAAISIFVNPLQFGPDEDFAVYPRDEQGDLARAEDLGVDVVLVPPVEEMYPPGDPPPTIEPGAVGERLEGAARPGHFRGVLTVVARLFSLAGACRAYFGEKDAQQLFLVRRMAAERFPHVEVVPCPTVREPDGLAMSSRNALLTAEDREAAGCLFLALSEAAEAVRGGERDAARLVAVLAREIGATPQARLDYAAVVDEATFEEVRRIDGPARALVAARFGPVRLIDNLALPVP
ncbi:MAG: pantoate--beta-alanine ligase [Candidatus Velamenicoccus archaeovorus]